QAQSEQEPLTPCQLRNAGGQSRLALMPEEKAPSSGAFLPASLMYFCSGQPMHFCSGVDTPDLGGRTAGAAAASARAGTQGTVRVHFGAWGTLQHGGVCPHGRAGGH